MEVSQKVVLTGNHNQVLEDTEKLIAFVELLPSARLVDESFAEVSNSEVLEWPTYSNRLLKYKGKEITISKVQDKIFSLLYQARGGLVPEDQLQQVFAERRDPKAFRGETHRLRKQLEENLPEIEIVTAGTGYYLQVH